MRIDRDVPVVYVRRKEAGGGLEKGRSTFFVFQAENALFWPGASPRKFKEGSDERKLADNGTLIGLELPYGGFREHSSVWARQWAVKPFEA